MSNKLLLAIDQFEPGQAAVDFTIGLAGRSKSAVQVLHVRELPASLRVPALESADEAEVLVQETVSRLQTAGIAAEGEIISDQENHVAHCIVEEASNTKCDAIVLGSLRLRGLQSIGGHGIRERVLKMSPLPVIVAPTALRADKRILARH
jgi:nucleotide-binding universal stress UspA family protein